MSELDDTESNFHLSDIHNQTLILKITENFGKNHHTHTFCTINFHKLKTENKWNALSAS